MKATKTQIAKALEENNGDVGKVAKKFNISKAAVYKRIKKICILEYPAGNKMKETAKEIKDEITLFKNDIVKKEAKKIESVMKGAISAEEMVTEATKGLMYWLQQKDKVLIMYVLDSLGGYKAKREVKTMIEPPKDVKMIFSLEGEEKPVKDENVIDVETKEGSG